MKDGKLDRPLLSVAAAAAAAAAGAGAGAAAVAAAVTDGRPPTAAASKAGGGGRSAGEANGVPCAGAVGVADERAASRARIRVAADVAPPATTGITSTNVVVKQY